jgi:hypothetical protein
MYIAANDLADTCSRPVAVRTCRPAAVSTRALTYEVSDDDDWDDEEFLDHDATYVAAADVRDACLSRHVVYTRPEVLTTTSARYIPAELVAQDSRILDSEPMAVVTDDTALIVEEPDPVIIEDADLVISEPDSIIAEDASFMAGESASVVTSQPRWVALDEDEVFDDLDPTWIAEVEAATGAGTVSYVPGGDVEVGGTAVSWVPVDDVDGLDMQSGSYVPVEEIEAEPVSYVPVDDVEETYSEPVSYVPAGEFDTQPVSYVPADTMDTQMVSYVPVADVDDVETTYIAADACPLPVSEVSYIDDDSAVIVESDLVAGLQGTQQIAGNFGYRDGFEDGQEAALEGDLYHPENSGDYQKATEGYEDEFGDKDVYKDSYRSSYLAGYRAGFESGAAV